MVIMDDVINVILPLMKRYLVLLLFCLMPASHAAEESVVVLGAEFWFTPRHGDVIATNEGVRAAVKRLIVEPEAYLAVRYPASESGELWGLELQAWLVSLGLVSDRIELQSRQDLPDAVELVVISPDVEIEDTTPLPIDADMGQTMMESNSVETIETEMPEESGNSEIDKPSAETSGDEQNTTTEDAGNQATKEQVETESE